MADENTKTGLQEDFEKIGEKADKLGKVADNLSESLSNQSSFKLDAGNFTRVMNTNNGGSPLGSVNAPSGILNASGMNIYNPLSNETRGSFDDEKQSAGNLLTSQFQGTDAYAAYNKITSTAQLFGANLVPTGYSKSSLGNAINSHIKKSKTAGNIIDTDLNKAYTIGNIHGNTAMDTYRQNMNEINRYFSDHGINSGKMTKGQIDQAIRTGKIGNRKLSANDIQVMKEFKFFKEKENAAQKIMSVKHFQTSKAWIKYALKDTEAGRGFSVATTSVKVVKATGMIGGAAYHIAAPVSVAAGSAAIGGVGALASASGKVVAKGVANASSKIAIKTGSKAMAKVSVGAQKASSFFSVANKASRNLVKIAPQNGLRVGKFRISNVKNNIKNRIYERTVGALLSRMNLVKTLLRQRLQRRFFGRVMLGAGKGLRIAGAIVRAPFKALGALSKLLTKIIIAVGGAFLILVIFDLILVAITSIFNSPNGNGTPKTHEVTEAMQDMWDRVYEYHKAYENNIWNFMDGTEMAEKKVPQTWDLEEKEISIFALPGTVSQYGERNYSINDDGIKYVDADMSLKGYNLAHYWGKENFRYTSTVPVYEEYLIDDGEDSGAPRYGTRETGETREISVIGESGIYGHIGGGEEFPLDDLNDYMISKGDVVYSNRDTLANDIKTTYDYRGCVHVEFDDYENQYPKWNRESEYFKFGYNMTNGEVSEYQTLSPDQMDNVKADLEGTYTGKNPNIHYYNMETFYRSLAALSCATVQNMSDMDTIGPGEDGFFYRYSKAVFDNVMDTSEVELQTEYMGQGTIGEGGRLQITTVQEFPHTKAVVIAYFDNVVPNFRLKTTYKNTGLLDMASLDTAQDVIESYIGGETMSKYKLKTTWDGWWNAEDGYSMTDAYKYAVDNYGFSDETFFDYYYQDVVIPSDMCKPLSEAEMEEMINDLIATNGGIDERTKQFIEFALQCVGQFYYKYGGKSGAGLDCSGFINYVMTEMGNTNWSQQSSCAGILSSHVHSRFSGNFSSLKPGSLIIENNKAGTASGSDNHIVMYCGIRSDGTPLIVECTTTDVSGVQISSQKRINTISGYDYVIDPSNY